MATLATPNPDIVNHPMVKRLEVHNDTVLTFEGDKDVRKISRKEWKELLDGYIAACVDASIPEINIWNAGVNCTHTKKSFYSSKGAEIHQDMQNCWLMMFYGFIT